MNNRIFNKERFEELKEKYGGFASWALYAKDESGEVDVGDVSLLQNYSEDLNSRFMLVGLNAAGEGSRTDKEKNLKFKGFHFSNEERQGNDDVLQYAVSGTELEGAYITDYLLLDSEVTDDNGKKKTIKSIFQEAKHEVKNFTDSESVIKLYKKCLNNDQKDEVLDIFFEQIKTLGDVKYIILMGLSTTCKLLNKENRESINKKIKEYNKENKENQMSEIEFIDVIHYSNRQSIKLKTQNTFNYKFLYDNNGIPTFVDSFGSKENRKEIIRKSFIVGAYKDAGIKISAADDEQYLYEDCNYLEILKVVYAHIEYRVSIILEKLGLPCEKQLQDDQLTAQLTNKLNHLKTFMEKDVFKNTKFGSKIKFDKIFNWIEKSNDRINNLYNDCEDSDKKSDPNKDLVDEGLKHIADIRSETSVLNELIKKHVFKKA